MDEMLADLISEGAREGLETARARGRTGGRKPKLTARQAEVGRGMHEEKGDDGKRKYTVAEIAETFGVSRKTVYRHLEPSGGRRQPGKTTLLLGVRQEHLATPIGEHGHGGLLPPPATES
jgi:DNA invertase Pin-like site-specific DNA recombinase